MGHVLMATHRRHQKWVKNAVSKPVFSDTSLLNRWFWVNEVSWVSLLISSSTELLYSAIYLFELAVGRLFRHCLIFVISCHVLRQNSVHFAKKVFQVKNEYLGGSVCRSMDDCFINAIMDVRPNIMTVQISYHSNFNRLPLDHRKIRKSCVCKLASAKTFSY